MKSEKDEAMWPEGDYTARKIRISVEIIPNEDASRFSNANRRYIFITKTKIWNYVRIIFTQYEKLGLHYYFTDGVYNIIFDNTETGQNLPQYYQAIEARMESKLYKE